MKKPKAVVPVAKAKTVGKMEVDDEESDDDESEDESDDEDSEEKSEGGLC